MSTMTLIYLLAASVVTGIGLGAVADMDAREIGAQVLLLVGMGISMYGLIALLA